MSPRVQRLLIIFLVAYHTLFGGSYYTEQNPVLRVAHQIGTALLLILWLITLWREGRPFPTTHLDRPLLVYGGVLFLAAVFALDPRISLEYTWPLLTHFLGFYLLVDLMRRGRQRWVVEALFITGAVVVILSIVEFAAWYFGLPLAPQFVQGWPELSGLTIPPVIHKLGLALNVSTLLGNFTATLVPLAAAWGVTARARDLRIGAWLLAVALAVVLILTQSRSALLALAAAAGVLLLAWLLRAEVRTRFPAVLRPLLDRRILLGGAALAGILLVGFAVWTSVRSLRSGDVARLDLWRSAVEIARDRPLLGVGPHQYGSALRWYGDPELSASEDRLVTAHNLILNILAETGIVGLLAVLWVGAAFLALWWRAWKNAGPGHRRRLEGCLAALVGFGAQSLVDTFILTQTLLPVLIIAAYTVAGGVSRAEAVKESMAAPVRQGRIPIFAALAILVAAQVAYLPVHAGELAYGRALRAFGAGQYTEVLDALRQAQAVDPWLDLYPLAEAYTLGLMANDDPAGYLEQAIDAHEQALALNPTWDQGWHNLAALYAQAGRAEEAVAAAETAVTWNPVPASYSFSLGRYYEALGNRDAARAAYREALRRNANLASSGFWTDPAHPERAAMLGEILDSFADDPAVGLPLALMAGDADRAAATAQGIDVETAAYPLLRNLAYYTLWFDDDPASCPECFIERAWQQGVDQQWTDDILLAELALERDGTAPLLDVPAEQAARLALFLSEGQAARAWYVLAQVGERSGGDDAAINARLARAVPPVFARQDFAAAVYGRIAFFDELPQARTPALSRRDVEPWLRLAERYAAAGQTDRLRRVYETLLLIDPYAWDIRQQFEALPLE